MNGNQLRTILWLRWRLTRNQWAKAGGVGAVVAAIVAVGAAGVALMGLVGGVAVGAYLLGTAKPLGVMAVWLALTAAFLLFWLIGLLNELQRSESIDLQRLMHLPVALAQIFFVNYAASHFAISLSLVVPAMIGLSIGLAWSRGATMLLMIPLALSMVLMITAWTYYLRGWLATLMSNPRRRRTVIMLLTAGFILLVQAPNLYFNVFRNIDRPSKAELKKETKEQKAARDEAEEAQIMQVLNWQPALPPLWVPVGARALAEGRVLPALLGTLGCLAIGGLGLRLAYRSTLRFYHGESGGKASAVPKTARAAAVPGRPEVVGNLLVERRLPGVPEQAAALALATFQSMLRAPEVKMAWATSFIVTLVVGAPLLFRGGSKLPELAKPFVATGVVIFALFLLVGFLANQFGFDRDGFRALILSPMERRLMLIGKNLACLPVGAISALVLLTVVTIWLHLSPLVFVATLLQLVAGLMVAGVGGNLLSILVPYRIQPGSMKPTKMPGLAMLVLVVCQLAFPLLMAPAFLPPLIGMLWQRFGGPPAALVNLLLSLLLAAVSVVVYWQTLGPLGRLLHRRETKILGIVTVEVE